jgi:hypothetical protein
MDGVGLKNDVHNPQLARFELHLKSRVESFYFLIIQQSLHKKLLRFSFLVI